MATPELEVGRHEKSFSDYESKLEKIHYILIRQKSYHDSFTCDVTWNGRYASAADGRYRNIGESDIDPIYRPLDILMYLDISE